MINMEPRDTATGAGFRSHFNMVLEEAIKPVYTINTLIHFWGLLFDTDMIPMKPRDRAALESQGKWDKRQWQGDCWLPFTLLSLRHTLCAALTVIQHTCTQNETYFPTQWPSVLDSTLWHWQLPPPAHRHTGSHQTVETTDTEFYDFMLWEKQSRFSVVPLPSYFCSLSFFPNCTFKRAF